MKLFNPIHNLFLILSIVFIVISFFRIDHTWNVHVHDTMFVISLPHAFKVIAILLSLLWLLYTFSNKYLFSRKLYRVHVIGTLLLIGTFMAISEYNYYNSTINAPYSYLDPSKANSNSGFEVNDTLMLIVLTLTSLQLLYPLNLTLGIIKNKKH